MYVTQIFRLPTGLSGFEPAPLDALFVTRAHMKVAYSEARDVMEKVGALAGLDDPIR